jgi:MFS family permease
MLGIFAGAATGFLIAPLGIAAIFNILIVVILLGGLVTAFGIQETNLTPVMPRFSLGEFLRGLSSPFKNVDFAWVFFNRLLIGMGFFTIQEFILYYMKDAFKSPYTLPILGTVATTPEGAVAFFFPALFLGAIVTSLLAGVLSDRYGRKSIAYAATLVLGIPCMFFTFSHSFPLAIVLGMVFGLGYGAYDSLSWAMASDVLRSPADHGKDMGLWHMAIVLPQVIATPIGGFLLDQSKLVSTAYHREHMGYVIIFVVAVIYFMFSSIFLRQIKGLR